MPHRPVEKFLKLPDWIESVHDDCLKAMLTEAMVARYTAVTGGAEQHRSCRNVLRAGDRTLDAIAHRQFTPRVACAKAATALRKFNTASECIHPTAKR